MKIAVISSTILTCPPLDAYGRMTYGGLELIAWQIAKGLAEKGHQVLLIAPKGSIPAPGVEMHETTLREPEKQAFDYYKHKLAQCQVVIDHSWLKHSYLLKMHGDLKAPVLGVIHCPIDTQYSVPPPIPKPCFVAISKDQAQHVREHLKIDVRVAYNGVDLNTYKPNQRPRNERYLFLARFSSIKGPDIAVDVCKKCKVGCDFIGDDQITGEQHLIDEIKKQCIFTPKLRYVGIQPKEACALWFNHNKALLHPNKSYKESFGLTVCEAQLCGCPVIAWDYGALRETVCNQETGFLVTSQEQMEELIKTDAVRSIKSERCREWASQFSVEAMVNRYEILCQEAVETGGW